MRQLFLSEARVIQNMFRRAGIENVQTPDCVVVEYYTPPRVVGATAFNADFFIQFVDTDQLKDFRSFCCPVRPNTMGAEVFLTLDKSTDRPLRAELLAGEAFGAEHFSAEIDRIEREVSRNGIKADVAQSKYTRVFIIENDICFLVFPDRAEPTEGEDRVVLTNGTEGSIVCQMADNELICLDGWIKTEIADSDWFLVAEPDDD